MNTAASPRTPGPEQRIDRMAYHLVIAHSLNGIHTSYVVPGIPDHRLSAAWRRRRGGIRVRLVSSDETELVYAASDRRYHHQKTPDICHYRLPATLSILNGLTALAHAHHQLFSK